MLSARNQFKGRVVSVKTGGVMSEVVIRIAERTRPCPQLEVLRLELQRHG